MCLFNLKDKKRAEAEENMAVKNLIWFHQALLLYRTWLKWKSPLMGRLVGLSVSPSILPSLQRAKIKPLLYRHINHNQARTLQKMAMARTVRFSKIYHSKLRGKTSNHHQIRRLNNSLIHNKSKCRSHRSHHKLMLLHKISRFLQSQIDRENQIRMQQRPKFLLVIRQKGVREISRRSLLPLSRTLNWRQRNRRILLVETLSAATIYSNPRWTRVTKAESGHRILSKSWAKAQVEASNRHFYHRLKRLIWNSKSRNQVKLV